MPNTHSTLTSLFSDIADAIRGKTGSSATIVADDFPTAIANIPTSGGIVATEVANATGTTLAITSSESTNIQSLSVTENGTYTAGDGVDGYSPVIVDVQSGGSVVTRAVSFISNDASAMYYTDATMTPQSITSGNRDLNNVQMPIGSLVVYVRTSRPEPMPLPPSQLGVSQLASYTVGSMGQVIIYQVIS